MTTFATAQAKKPSGCAIGEVERPCDNDVDMTSSLPDLYALSTLLIQVRRDTNEVFSAMLAEARAKAAAGDDADRLFYTCQKLANLEHATDLMLRVMFPTETQ